MTDTELLIRDCLSAYAEQAEQADLVRAAKAQRGRASRFSGLTGRAFSSQRSIAAVAVAAVVALGAVFVVGSFHTTSTSNAALHHQADTLTAPRPQSAGSLAPLGKTTAQGSAPAAGAAAGVPAPAPSVGSGGAATDFGVAAGATAQAPEAGDGVGVTATRLVKTGSMSLTVDKGQVGAAISQLVAMTRALGGYVSNSHTDDIAGTPSGEVTLRMPADNFEEAVTGAQKIGHQTSLSTSAHDVTGKYVDLHARLTALQRTRQTYLTILSRATTIGEILSVQQRIDNTQSQIEQLQGELKVLRNQSADGTLTVDVAEKGAAATVSHHHRSGLSKAWHDSTSRFSHGVDAIVGALGPLLLALILLGIALIVIRLGMRRARRATT